MSDFAVTAWLCVLVALSPVLIFVAAVMWMGLRLALRGRGWRGRTQRHAGLCASCGYDLRASPERCPECGAAAKGAK